MRKEKPKNRERNTEMDNQLAQLKAAIEARLKAEPRNADAWRELAQVKMMLCDAAGAENDCIECLRIDPKNAAGLVLMGNLLTTQPVRVATRSRPSPARTSPATGF